MKGRLMVRRIGSVISVAALMIAMGCMAANATAASGADSGRDAAVETVKQFVARGQSHGRISTAHANTSDLKAHDRAVGRNYDHYEVDGEDIWAVVDARNGKVSQFLLRKYNPAAGKAVMSETAARAAGESYFADLGISTKGLAVRSERKVRGPDVSTYSIVWERRENGVLLPDSRSVEIDAVTGAVFVVRDIEQAYTPPAAPATTREQAIAAAIAATGATNAVPDEPSLRVAFTVGGEQYLAWDVQLAADSGQGWQNHFWVEVNATTGDAVVVGRG
jgi:hypothetical protein